MVKTKVNNESKEEKFRRIASARTQKLLDDLRLLGNCSNVGTYSYTEKDIDKIFNNIEKEVGRVKMMFNTSKDEKFEL